jgi:Xaa-Pro aminopeptidase
MREKVRRKRALQAALDAGAEALVVTHGPDVRYLSGFTGSSGAVALVGGRAALFTDGRYTTQAKAEAEGLRVVIDQRAPGVQAVEWLAAAGVKKCAFDAGQTTVAVLESMKKAVNQTLKAVPGSVRRSFLVATDGLVAKIRQVKDEDEIKLMRRAAALGCGLFDAVLQYVVAGATETQVAAQLEFMARLAGVDAMSFETIVASGERSALPHGRATGAKLPAHGFVTLDFGVLLGGYCSDMTRTVHVGKTSEREWDVYHSVLEAQQAAVAAVAPGVSCGQVDEAARSVLRKAGLEKEFSHSTGHGVGLEIHEGPRIAAKQEQVLEPGMVITIEPGAYLSSGAAVGVRRSGSRTKGVHPVAKAFGVRIEDMVLVTESGCEVLTAASPKDWMEL